MIVGAGAETFVVLALPIAVDIIAAKTAGADD